MTAPVLLEAHPRRGGAELRYQIGEQTASVLIEGGRVCYPHYLHSEGESLGPDLDAAIVQAAQADLARARLAGLIGGRR